MFQIFCYVRYSNASIKLDSSFFFGAIIFFLLCGILIFQNQIWEEEDFTKNKKWLNWKASAIKANKSDLSRIYPAQKK
tara:strand:+ start:263 stop:496 length:234 start_codon:yes stop_codon:yes gene_type:complete